MVSGFVKRPLFIALVIAAVVGAGAGALTWWLTDRPMSVTDFRQAAADVCEDSARAAALRETPRTSRQAVRFVQQGIDASLRAEERFAELNPPDSMVIQRDQVLRIAAARRSYLERALRRLRAGTPPRQALAAAAEDGSELRVMARREFAQMGVPTCAGT